MKKTIFALAAIAFAAPVLAGPGGGGNANPDINMSGTRDPNAPVIEYPSRATVFRTVIEKPRHEWSAALITHPDGVGSSQDVLPKDSDKKRNRKPVSGARG